MKYIFIISTFLFLAVSFSSCDKSTEDDCYSRELEENHSGICIQDCPGVCGCDGITYCNACIASSHGITEVTNGPCE